MGSTRRESTRYYRLCARPPLTIEMRIGNGGMRKVILGHDKRWIEGECLYPIFSSKPPSHLIGYVPIDELATLPPDPAYGTRSHYVTYVGWTPDPKRLMLEMIGEHECE